MTPERWQQIKRTFHEALEIDSGARQSFLARVCGADIELRQEVEGLLDAHEQTAHIVDQPVAEVAAQLIEASDGEALIDAEIGPYLITREIGRGGMGAVYLAEDARLGRKVALKMLPREFTRDAERVRRFQREARAASALNHPGILTIFEIGEASGYRFIATEFVEGQTLRQRLKSGSLDLAERLQAAEQVASALQAAHQVGIIHRDIKPENIMLRPDGYVKVLDFGIAKLTEDEGGNRQTDFETKSGMVMGTASYMSPEQARGLKVDARTDLFSLGVLIYEMVTGHRPFTGASYPDVLVAILHNEPLPLVHYTPGAPIELQKLVNRALAKNREDRYQSAAEMMTDLKRIRRQIEMDGAGRLTAASGKLAYKSSSQPSRDTDSGSQPARPLASGEIITALAVLPFVNASGDAQLDYLCDGITENLINNLARLPGLRVVARSSAFRYKAADGLDAGRELGAEAVLTGRIMQQVDAILIRVALERVEDGTHLWGSRYQRQYTDLFTIEAEITQEISEQLRLNLSGSQKRQLAEKQTRNAEAYQSYLRGRWFWNQRSEDSLRRAIACFEQAIALDPEYAQAYAGLADVYTILWTNGVWPPADSLPQARTFTERALRLDDRLAEAHAARGIILAEADRDWPAAEAAFLRALELNPGYAIARVWYAVTILATLERFDEARLEAERALELDPVSFPLYTSIGWILFLARRYDEALATLERAGELEPQHPVVPRYRGMVYEQMGRHEEAIAAYHSDLLASGGAASEAAALDEAYAAGGWPAYWRKRLDALRKEAEQHYVHPLRFAEIHVRLGERDEAFAQLEKACQERSAYVIWIKHPVFDGVRDDRRFTDLLRAMNLEGADIIATRVVASPPPALKRAAAGGSSSVKVANPTIAIVNDQPAATTGAVAAQRTGIELRATERRPKRAVLVASVAAALVLVAALVAYHVVVVARAPDSLAVMPFAYQNAAAAQSVDADRDYIADGITESLIYRLSQLPSLKIIARSSVFRYKGKDVDPKEVGQALGVRAVLTGRILQRGDALEVSVELVDARNNTVLWSERYQHRLADIATVQSEIANQIADHLQVRLTGNQQRRLARPDTRNAEAYQLYLKGRHLWNQRTAEAITKSIEYYRQATALDPDFALAYAGLADSYALIHSYGAMALDESHAAGKVAAAQAMEKDPQLADPHAALASMASNAYDWAGAEREFQQALALNPNYATAHHWYSHHLAIQGRFDEAIAEGARAVELDPISPAINTSLGVMFYYARRYGQAIEQLKKTADLDARRPGVLAHLGQAYEAAGRLDEAIAEHQKSLTLNNGDLTQKARLAHAYVLAGRRDEARRLLAELLALSQTDAAPQYEIATVYTALGDRDQAFSWLEKAIAASEGAEIWLKVDPQLDSLRDDPRYLALLRRIGLVQ